MSVFSQFLLPSAWAQDASGTQASGGMDMSMLINLWPLLGIFAVFYFLIIRPQQRKIEDQNKMIKSLQKGDHIITNGGMHGKIIKHENEHTVVVEIADNVHVKMLKSSISGLASKITEQGSTLIDNQGKK